MSAVETQRVVHPGGSVCSQKRWPDEIHADACWTTPKALCNIEAPIHPDDITADDEKVACAECREILDLLKRPAPPVPPAAVANVRRRFLRRIPGHPT